MKAHDFIQLRENFWLDFEQEIKTRKINDEELFLIKLRQIAQDLELSRQRFYPEEIIARLNQNLTEGYQLVAKYGDGTNPFVRWINMIFKEFPQTLRKEWKLFLLNNLLFWLPVLLFVIWGDFLMDWIDIILGDDQKNLAEMYGQDKIARNGFENDFQMFAHYIKHNVGIDFQIIGSGLIGGIGALFIILFNGVSIGSAAGFCTWSPTCVPENFWGFVVGHSAPELIGMLVVATGSMKIGLSWISPKGFSRSFALRMAGKKMMPLLWAGCLMTFLAAIIEGFWSAQAYPMYLKYTVGSLIWGIHLYWVFLSGREKVKC